MKMRCRGLALTAILLSATSMATADNGSGAMVGDISGYGEEAYFEETGFDSRSNSDLDDVSGYGEEAYFEESSFDSHSDSDLRDVAGSSENALFEESTAETGSDSMVGDIPVFGNESYHLDDDFSVDGILPAAYSEGSVPMYQQGVPGRTASYTPVDVADLQRASFRSGHRRQGGASCDGCGSLACDGGCGSNRFRPSGRSGGICSIFDRCNCNTWATMEFLMWFAQDRDTPPLITTSDPGTLPVMGGPGNTQVVFGDKINGELSVGFRGDMGTWLSQNVGVGGRFWILAENSDSYGASGDGSDMSIGRPYFDTDPGVGPARESALIVAGEGIPGFADFNGEISAESTLDIWAAEGYARFRFGSTRSSNLDFIGGYSHFEIDDSLVINSTTVNTTASLSNPVGTRRLFSDVFETENRFDGGQIGFEMVSNHGCWMVRSLTKVHLGNMNQSVSINGFNTRQVPGGPVTGNSGGVLASADPIDAERDVFAFAPEANFKLAYRFRPNVLLSVGYSFIYFDNVALSGEQIDRNVDGVTIGTGTAGDNPNFVFEDSSLWVQGVDLGVVIDF